MLIDLYFLFVWEVVTKSIGEKDAEKEILKAGYLLFMLPVKA